jgi:hypothetical protein
MLLRAAGTSSVLSIAPSMLMDGSPFGGDSDAGSQDAGVVGGGGMIGYVGSGVAPWRRARRIIAAENGRDDEVGEFGGSHCGGRNTGSGKRQVSLGWTTTKSLPAADRRRRAGQPPVGHAGYVTCAETIQRTYPDHRIVLQVSILGTERGM